MFSANAFLNKDLQTPANTCKHLQTPANTCKELQSAAKTCKDLQNAAKRCKPLRDLQSAAKGFPELLWFMPDDMSALKEKSEKLDREEKEEWMRDLFGLRVKVPEHWFSGADRPWKWSSSSKPWECKIVDADFDTAMEKDPKFLIQCDDPRWPNWIPIRCSDVRRFSQIKHGRKTRSQQRKNLCKELPTPANTCKDLRRAAKRSKTLQAPARPANSAKCCKALPEPQLPAARKHF